MTAPNSAENDAPVRLRHTTTDPRCTWHNPPRNWWQRRRFDRARGRVCVICAGWPRVIPPAVGDQP